MRVAVLTLAALFALGAGSVLACPMQTASKSQTVASNGESTPIPPKAQSGNNS